MSTPRLRLREDLIAGPHPEQDDLWMVYCERKGTRYEIPQLGWKLASALNQYSLEEIAEDSLACSGVSVSAEVVYAFAENLLEMGLLESSAAPKVVNWSRLAEGSLWKVEEAEQLPIKIHPQQRFTCDLAGLCCRQSYVVALSDTEVEEVKKAAKRLRMKEAPIVLLPTQPGKPWAYALDNEEACPFVDEQDLCQVHSSPAQPKICEIFPYSFVRSGSEVFATVMHRCACGALGEGELVAKQTREVSRKLSICRRVPVLPEQCRIDGIKKLSREAAVELTLQAAEQKGAWQKIFYLAQELLKATPDMELMVSGKTTEVSQLLDQLSEQVNGDEDIHLVAALQHSEHPQQDFILERMKKVGLYQVDADHQEELSRFVRDYLFGMRLFAFPSLGEGLLALGLAVASAQRGLPPVGAHPQLRTRIMLWEEILGSSGLRGILGRKGPLHNLVRDFEAVYQQLRLLQAWTDR